MKISVEIDDEVVKNLLKVASLVLSGNEEEWKPEETPYVKIYIGALGLVTTEEDMREVKKELQEYADFYVLRRISYKGLLEEIKDLRERLKKWKTKN